MTSTSETPVFRPAAPADAPQIEAIIDGARERMRLAGKQQWQDGYPSGADIARDITKGYGYVLTYGETIAAYGAVIFDGEPAYEALNGKWQREPPYVAVHRLAVTGAMTGKGLGALFMEKTGKLAQGNGIAGFRVDTNFDNQIMLRTLEKLGFEYRGDIDYQGAPRMAFEKVLL